MNLSDAKPGTPVIYIPAYANGNRYHPDSERGKISSFNSKYIFVRFHTRSNGEWIAACDPRDLILDI